MILYHVTEFRNLRGIQENGLMAGGGQGMAILYQLRHNAPINPFAQAQNFVHLTGNWETIIRYVDHMIELDENCVPVILRCITQNHLLLDPDEPYCVRQIQTIPVPRIWVSVYHNTLIGINANDGDEFDRVHNAHSFWLPLWVWSGVYRPAYPDQPSIPVWQ